MNNKGSPMVECRRYPRGLWQFLVVLACFVMPAAHVRAADADAAAEPNLATAEQWWPQLRDFWTPVGWKHHRFRYNVFFDGMIYADPSLSQTAKDWKGQGIQIRTVPLIGRGDGGAEVGSAPANVEKLRAERYVLQDNRRSLQGWTDNAAPVLWTEWSSNGALLRQHVFGHVLGGTDVKTGLEPLFAWVRLSVHDICPGLPVPPRYTFCLQINAPHVTTGMTMRKNITMHPEGATYPRALKAADSKDASTGLRIVEPDAKVRLAANRPATAATIDVPETYIAQSIRQFERFAEVLSERDPETGRSVPLSGSLAYVKVWATPTGKMVSMFLDPMGYHDLAAEFLEPFIAAQGTRKPPSTFLEKHPGFLGSPEAFKSIDWMADHGSLLFAMSNHALLTSDVKAKQRYVEPILKACEFIRDARRVKGHGGVEGILPPARYSDAAAQTQGVWSDGWNFKGLATAGRFLRQINHPRAAEFTAEAEDYKKTFLAAFRAAAAKSTTWTDDGGNVHPFIPTSLYGAVDQSARHPFYLDTGPLQLVFSGLMQADDPLMESALAWFRDGPILRFARHDSNFMQVGFLEHEMSSCIPGYSWNVFHSHQLGDRAHFLEAMYSQYAGAISRQTMTVCETRYGITGRITHADTPFYLARLAVVDDQIVEGELHLLRLCPLAWVSKDRETKFENMPTEFGPVTLKWQLSGDGQTLRLTYEAQLHAKPKEVFLYVPPLDGLKTISVNGRDHPAVRGAKLPI